MRTLKLRKAICMLSMCLLTLNVALMPVLPTYAASDDTAETTEATETTTEEGEDMEVPGKENLDSGATMHDIDETEFGGFVEVPTPTLDKGTAQFFDTIGGKILGILLKLLSVGMLLTVVMDLVFVAVPATQGLFLSLERSGIPLISNEAHKCAGVPRAQAQGAQNGRGSSYGGYGGGYGGYGGGYDDGYGGGDYGMGGGRNGQNQQGAASGVGGYIKESFIKVVLVIAFCVFMLTGAYMHLGYALGNAVSSLIGKI